MDSWMKRGILLNSRKDSKHSMSIAAEEDTASEAARPANKPREPFKIPPVPFEYDDDVPENNGRPHVGKVVMIPAPLPSSGPGPYTLSLLYPGVREAIEALPGFPTPYNPSIRVHYCIGSAPGAGKGMFALTDFKLGDLILRERPICLFPQWFAGNNDASEEYAMSILSLLKPEDSQDFFNLANCRTGENMPSGIVNTNGLYAGFMPGEYHGEYACICRDLCRVNHSCRPNAVYRWRLKDMVYELRALLPIKEGEQIFVSYLDNLQLRSARRAHLRSAYGFICNCPACAIPPSDISFRDNLRELLAETVQLDKANDDSVLDEWLEDRSLPDDHVIAQSMEIIEAMNAEGLIDRDICNGHYPRLVKAYCALKDREKAKVWAERLALTLIAIYGQDYAKQSTSTALPDDVAAEADAMDNSNDLLRVVHVSKQFNKKTVVDNVSFGVSQNTIFAMLGPNGAGKTTTFNMIRGDIVPDGGDMFIADTSVVRHPRLARHYLGVCPQFTAIDSQMTVREHLIIYGRLKGVPRNELTANVEVVLRATALFMYADRLASKLSGGNKRKLSLAIALIGNPSVLLIDEFSTGIDAKMKRDMWNTLRNVAVGKAVVITTHSMEEASALADRVGILAKRLLVIGSIESLSARYAMYEVHFSCRTREELVKVQNLMGAIPGSRMADDVATRFEVPIESDSPNNTGTLSLKRLFEVLTTRWLGN